MTVLKRHSAAQRQPAWAFLLALIVGLLLWLAAASLVRGWQNAAAAEPTSTPNTSAPTIAFSPAPLLAQKDAAAKSKDGEDSPPKDSKPRKQPSDKSSPGESAAEFSPQEESAVQDFVAANHPELGQVLGSLKKKHAREYARAIHDLSHTQARLEQTRRNDRERYERDLAAWQLKSRIQLLVARIKMNPDDEKLRTELQEVVAEQVTQQREHLQTERDRLQQRLDKLDSQLEKLAGKYDVLVEQRMKQWLTSAENNRGGSPQRKKNVKQKPSKESDAKVKLEK